MVGRWKCRLKPPGSGSSFLVGEVPVRYRRRVGFSKISGTLKGTVLAGWKIITTIFRYR